MNIPQKQNIPVFLEMQNSRMVLRFMTCGSVDDGKSTLIGRLLFESNNIYDDQLKALEKDSSYFSGNKNNLDFALLVDGLQSEREQGITIDVAYRFFSTDRRRFIVADTPGHEQYTRNMATAASTADLAVVLIDARKGVLGQTCRHTRILSMMRVRHLVLVINKMDLVDFSESKFQQIENHYRQFIAQFDFETLQVIPISAIHGDNILEASIHMPWYQGSGLLNYLETIDIKRSNLRDVPFRMPVQWVNRINPDFRGFCGQINEGIVKLNDKICVAPSGMETHVKGLLQNFAEVSSAEVGASVTLILADEIDVSRGDVLVETQSVFLAADQFRAKILWMNSQAMIPGRQYLLKLHCKEVTATVTDIKYCEDIYSGAQLAAKELKMNDIAVVNLSTSHVVVFEPYSVNKTMGSFILIDKFTFETVGAGMIEFALHRSDNINWQPFEVNKQLRAAQKNQKPCCIWFTGLSGAGKSTIASLLEKRLFATERHTYVLDGDNVRHGLNRDLGFTVADRVENVRRTAEVARLMVDAGLIVLVSMISPFKAERVMARNMFKDEEFIEVFVDTSFEECERRDVKGLYAKARNGELKNFTGIDSAYEVPDSPDIHLKTQQTSPQDCVDHVRCRFMRNSI